MRDTIGLFDLRLVVSPKKEFDTFYFSNHLYLRSVFAI